MTETATGEAPIPSHCLYAISDGETIVNERGGATIVPWWSFTKTVIAAAVLTLVRDGRLSLDDPVDGQPFTLRQLLQHRAGLPDYSGSHVRQQTWITSRWVRPPGTIQAGFITACLPVPSGMRPSFSTEWSQQTCCRPG
jgi:hypothetical protein